MEPFRWGILGPGRIAKRFAMSLQCHEEVTAYAVASRDAERARAFAEENGAEVSYDNYEALLADPKVEAVYIATPHVFHCEQTLMCLDAGKPVMVEKPMALNEAEARRMVERARERGVFLMEAMWARFVPFMDDVRQWIAEGELGEPRMVMADFGFRGGADPEGRHLNPELGGGGLLDVGCYPISLASMYFGGAEPVEITGVADIGETGVDEQATMSIKYPGGGLAALACAIRTFTAQDGWLIGTEARAHLGTHWWAGKKADLWRRGELVKTVERPFEGPGYQFEAAAVGRLVREGAQECPLMLMDESLVIMRTMDRLREQWGIRYPQEK